MKKLILVMLICIVSLSAFTSLVSADNEITVLVNGEKLESDVPAQTLPVYDDKGEYVGDRVMLPLRAISEKLNVDVHWNSETSGITLYRKGILYAMWVGMDTAFCLNNFAVEKGYEMDVVPTIIDSRTLVPVRAFAEILGAEVNWIGETKTVDIKYDLGDVEENAGTAEQFGIFEFALRSMYDKCKSYTNGTIETVTGKIVLESGEEIKFELYPTLAPETCKNFINLAKDKFYDGTIFHRVIKDFVAQGGGFDKEYTHKEAEPIVGEFFLNGFFNIIPHNRGTISLARSNDLNSGSSQFFIVHKDSQYLNINYASFGHVTEGMDIVDKICECETDELDSPKTPIVVKSVIIDE